jgi:hypothetical protein
VRRGARARSRETTRRRVTSRGRGRQGGVAARARGRRATDAAARLAHCSATTQLTPPATPTPRWPTPSNQIFCTTPKLVYI